MSMTLGVSDVQQKWYQQTTEPIVRLSTCRAPAGPRAAIAIHTSPGKQDN